MANKAEMDAQWTDMRRRLGADSKLAKVIDSLDAALPKQSADEANRPRLKAPYSGAATIDNATDWI